VAQNIVHSIMNVQSGNFRFLELHDVQLVRLGALAERSMTTRIHASSSFASSPNCSPSSSRRRQVYMKRAMNPKPICFAACVSSVFYRRR
jgi:hypothetical protein